MSAWYSSLCPVSNMTVGDNIGFGLKMQETTEQIKKRGGRNADLIHMPGYADAILPALRRAAATRSPGRAPGAQPSVRCWMSSLRPGRQDPRIVALRAEIRAIQHKLGITASTSPRPGGSALYL